ncbi:hypothetical protein CIK05_00820 [Bdellovibrio sp. qaytius]|nr:hypothetical protein CIK05_00820 [Bdellovibrio sp. qaytius]
MFKLFKRFVVIIASLYSTQVFASASPACYSFSVPEGPEADAIVVARQETWCYQQLNDATGTLFVFNADAMPIKPELSFTVDADGMMTHASMMQGRRTVHKVLAKEFNPFSIPYNEPKGLQAHAPQFVDGDMMRSANEALRVLSTTRASVSTLAIEAGTFDENASIKPWRGYWWSYANRPLSNGSDSPMAKYDRFVKARTGTNPGSQSWENAHHTYHGINWEGHCNGWAASSVLRAEPKTSKTDSLSGVTFTVSDQKGLLSEVDYCVKLAFFGTRYRGPGSNMYDINAATFHKTLLYYIGNLKKPVAMDYKQLEDVDNHVISGYNMKIKKTGPDTYSVVAKLRVHKYDKARSNDPGDAPMYTRTYSYRLREEADGTLSGSWTSGNPDFMWVPLATEDCGSNNPRMDHARMQEILDIPSSMGSIVDPIPGDPDPLPPSI